MESYTAPPLFDKRTWELVGPFVLDTREIAHRIVSAYHGVDRYGGSPSARNAVVQQLIEDIDINKRFPQNNGVLLTGGAAAGKTRIAGALAMGGPDLAHTPTDALFDKRYSLNIDPSRKLANPQFFEYQAIEQYALARVDTILEMVRNIKRLKSNQLYDSDQVIVGGALQSLVTLFTYCNKCRCPAAEYRLPPEIFNVLVLLFQQWAPSVIVYVDARKEVREARAREQDKHEPGALRKRQLAFAFDRELREVTLHTLRQLRDIAERNGQELPLLYLSTDTIDLLAPEGFTPVKDFNELQGFIGRRLNHRVRDHVWARSIEHTWDD